MLRVTPMPVRNDRQAGVSGQTRPLRWRDGLPTLHGSGLSLRELLPSDAPTVRRLAETQLAWPVSAMVPRTDADSARFIA